MVGCEHDIVFWGMINVNRDNYLQGVVDVWMCRKCKTLFCDDKRYGEGLRPTVGFESIPDDEQWAILTCTTRKDVRMNSLSVKPGKKVAHACRDGETKEFVIREDFSLAPAGGTSIHRLYLVRDYLNRNIEAGFYRLTMK